MDKPAKISLKLDSNLNLLSEYITAISRQVYITHNLVKWIMFKTEVKPRLHFKISDK